MTNTEFVEDQRQREKEGRPNLGLSEEVKENMLKMEKEAKKLFILLLRSKLERFSLHKR